MRALALRDDGRTWFNLGVIRFKQNNTKGALEAFERAAKHAETKEQAAREIDKLRTAKGDAGPAREIQRSGSTSVQPTSPPRY
jgi:Tfp pilus assembly protein PilF